MHLCTYVLVYTPFLLRILRVFQNQYKKSLKIIQKPPSNLPRNMEPLPWWSLTSLCRTTKASVEVLRKFPLVPAQGSNPEPSLLGKSGVLPLTPPVLLCIYVRNNRINQYKFNILNLLQIQFKLIIFFFYCNKLYLNQLGKNKKYICLSGCWDVYLLFEICREQVFI